MSYLDCVIKQFKVEFTPVILGRRQVVRHQPVVTCGNKIITRYWLPVQRTSEMT
jgi:hypothetical protein